MKNMMFLLLCLLTLPAHAQNLKSVNFFQEGDVSKLIIETDGDVLAERFHVKDDKQIILDVKNVKYDKKVLRAIDTSEFDGATVFISGYPKPGTTSDVRFAIQLRDNVRSLLENQGNKIVLNIENRFGVFSKNKVSQADSKTTQVGNEVLETNKDGVLLNVPKSLAIEDILTNLTLSGPKKYVGKKISINVKEISLPDLLKMIADTSGFNIIIDSDVSKVPPLTLTLTNVPWDQALDTIMSLGKLVASKNSNILSIKTFEKASTEKEAEAKAEQLKLGLEPLVTKVFPISYAELPALITIVTDYLTTGRGKIQQDARTNSLIVRDTVDVIERVKKIVELLDTQTPQILIESKIVEASENYSKRIGLTQGISFGYDPIIDTGTLTNAGPGFSFSSAPTSGAPTAIGMTVNVLRRLNNLNFNLELMESENKARIVTAPKVITQNKKPATITSSQQKSFPVQSVVNGVATITFQQLAATLNLTVTPHVTNEGAISMQVQISKGSFGAATPGSTTPPDLTTRQVNTNVLVDNGSTVVLGGLYATANSESHSGIPVLKDIPLIGWLFRTPYNPSDDKSELLIFLTPRIINQEEAGLIERESAPTKS